MEKLSGTKHYLKIWIKNIGIIRTQLINKEIILIVEKQKYCTIIKIQVALRRKKQSIAENISFRDQ